MAYLIARKIDIKIDLCWAIEKIWQGFERKSAEVNDLIYSLVSVIDKKKLANLWKRRTIKLLVLLFRIFLCSVLSIITTKCTRSRRKMSWARPWNRWYYALLTNRGWSRKSSGSHRHQIIAFDIVIQLCADFYENLGTRELWLHSRIRTIDTLNINQPSLFSNITKKHRSGS